MVEIRNMAMEWDFKVTYDNVQAEGVYSGGHNAYKYVTKLHN